MRRGRFILGAVLVSAIVVVAFHAYLSSLTSSLPSSPSFAPSNDHPNPTNPSNPTLTVSGPIIATVVSPMCALYSNPPCAMWVGTLYYMTIDGVNYRLIFPASMKAPLNGLQVVVTGTLVTPSTYESNQYTPQLSFRGDIYVISYSYAPST